MSRPIKPHLVWSSEHDDPTGAYWLYCICEGGTEGSGPCKVGVATDIAKRLSSLQGGNWRPLVVAWLIRSTNRDAALSIESFCLTRHRPDIFATDDRSRLASEWVSVSPSVLMETALFVINNRGDRIENSA